MPFQKQTIVFDFGKNDLALEIDVSVLPGIKLILKCCLSYSHSLLSLNRSFKIKYFAKPQKKVTFKVVSKQLTILIFSKE